MNSSNIYSFLRHAPARPRSAPPPDAISPNRRVGGK
ncbi:hypothetical protein A2U01_0054152 [Trifolium medium]|uniref:Uncharacterized protein n=1 Tax=Trifolium medium TaxID=97028 RepID=A0A392R9P8_9FABA|nr:hypothetical protein [Trifolium medium]